MTQAMQARMDKRTDSKVLCGRVDCGLQIAEVREYDQEGTWEGTPALLEGVSQVLDLY